MTSKTHVEYTCDRCGKEQTVLKGPEVWVDNQLLTVYYGQDAIDVELGKIPVPKGAKLKVMDF